MGTSPLLALSVPPELAVTPIPSPLPRPPADHERAGSGPQGQGHRRPAPGEQGDNTSPGVTPPSPVLTAACPSLSPRQCFRKEAALHTRHAFHPTVAGACQEQRTGLVGSAGGGLGSPLLARGG